MNRILPAQHPPVRSRQFPLAPDCGTNKAMTRPEDTTERRRRPPIPLDSARLEELALAYVARFATSEGKLADYLRRKLRERGWDSEAPPPVAELVARMAGAGYVDDEAFARSRTAGLLRRGYGERRISQALGAAGIAAEVRAQTAPEEAEARRAALAMAARRGFGPFGLAPLDRARREKQIAAMLRAGHRLDSAREMVDAASISVAEEWVAAAADGSE